MASIFDPPDPPEETPTKRSKIREGLTPSQLSQGKRRLYDMVEAAFRTLESAMQSADFNTAVKAAQILLDRAGFGPKSTMEINQTTVDLTELTREQLAERAALVAEKLRRQIMTEESRITAKTPDRVM